MDAKRCILVPLILFPLFGGAWEIYGEEDGKTSQKGPVQRILVAHSHNDYHRDKPLFDALDHGFSSVEADIFFVGDRFLVAHGFWEWKGDRTLEKLYLDPLLKLFRENQGHIYPSSVPHSEIPLFLLIDVKTDAEKTYPPLAKLLSRYEEMLSHRREGKWVKRGVQIILSGNVARKLVLQDDPCYVAFDGHAGDLNSGISVEDMPWISEDWNKYLQWSGKGEIPLANQNKLTQFRNKVHQEKRKIRFWGAPDRPEVWDYLFREKVDWINTDRPDSFSTWFRAQNYSLKY